MSTEEKDYVEPMRITLSKQLAARLYVEYPEIFNRDKPRPLAIKSLRRELIDLPWTKTRIVDTFMNYWVNRPEYLQAMQKPGTLRRNLDGSPQQPVRAAEREYAAQLLKERENGEV